MLDASTLLILTARDQMEADGKPIDALTSEEAIHLMDEGHFDEITTLPKIDACVSFVTSGEERTAIIGNLEDAYHLIRGRRGTRITK